MIITDKFVFVHIPKTGGVFLREMILHHLKHITPNANEPHHSPAHIYSGDLPVLYVKRDFESWVKSWEKYWTLRPKESTNPFFACKWSGGNYKKYYDCMYEYMITGIKSPIKISFNNLSANFCSVLMGLGVADEDIISKIMNEPKRNVTHESNYLGA